MIGRRNLLAAGAMIALVPRSAFARSDPTGMARAALDAAAASSSIEERYRLLRAIPLSGLPEALRIDVEGALAGASVEATIAREFPFTGALGAPFAVSPSSGSWRSISKASAPVGAALVGQLDAETERMRSAAASGIALPSSLLPSFLASFDAAASAVRDAAVAGALARQRAALTSSTAPGDGLGRSSRGRMLYAALLHLRAGEAVDPERLGAHMQTLCATLSARADRLLRGQGLDRSSVADRLRTFARDPRFLYSDDDAGRDHAVGDMNGWLDRARASLPDAFGTIPPATRFVRAHRMSASDEAAGRAGYRIIPDVETGAGGGYFVDLSHIRQRPSWSLHSVVHHELLPGHMMQLSLQEKARPHPLRLHYAPGFVEGWAIYAEQLAARQGLFADDPAGEIGYLQWMLFRAGRAWADVGVHLHGWSMADVERNLAALQGDPAIFAPFVKDAARLALQPADMAGQAWNWQAFAIAGETAGAVGSPSRRDFHDRVLRYGALPIATWKAEFSRIEENKPALNKNR
jgi:uncharacterized protein (DUF885 family)